MSDSKEFFKQHNIEPIKIDLPKSGMLELTPQRRKSLLKFAEKLGVEFKDIEILNLALTHSSYSNQYEPRLRNNERLEFLGDAVLELASSTYLFKKFKNLAEGDLTKTRASLVCQDSLAKLASKIDLGEMLLLGPTEQINGRKRSSTLEDAFEAVIGAIYIDRGWMAARNFVIRQLEPEIANVKIGGPPQPKDFKSRLQEIVQQNSQDKVTYVELSVTGPDHDREFECAVSIDGKLYGHGIGKNKKSAEQVAAQKTMSCAKFCEKYCQRNDDVVE